MKKIFSFWVVQMMALACFAQAQSLPMCRVAEQANATMPIVSTSPITTAPAGTVVSNMVRKGFSYYYSNGVYGGYNNSFVGEMVLATDGCIYIKNACASAAMNTYLKLDPVNDTLYVAHTAQMIYVDMSYDTPYSYYATRLVYTQISESSFGWQLEEVDGQVQADVYFTYKDGVLMQRDQTIISKDGYTYPYELIGYTNVSGGWIGFGDGCIVMEPVTLSPTSLPTTATPASANFSYQMLSSKCGKLATDAMVLQSAEVGDDYYVSCPLTEGGEMWIRGTINRQTGTVIFRSQYIGTNESTGVHQWFMPTTYSDWFDLIDEEENYGYWRRDYQRADSLVLSYNNGYIVSDTALHQCFTISRSADEVESSGNFANITLQPYQSRQTNPAAPIITNFDENNGLWGEFGFYIQPVDSMNMLLDKTELYYRIYHDHGTTPFVFTSDDYLDFDSDVTDVPYDLDDIDFIANGTYHLIVFYADWQNAGVQTVLKHNGQEWVSAIVWSDAVSDAVEEIALDGKGQVEKYLQNGQILIKKDGVVYTILGQIAQ